MLTTKFFYDSLISIGVSFFAGVPDSLLKHICAYISDFTPPSNNIITANEGAAVALAAGYHLATNKIPLVYMQNSGQGNATNPLISLIDKEVYNIPILLMVGWRGKPGIKDEPQHIKQGKITLHLLDTMGIKYEILSSNEKTAGIQLHNAVSFVKQTNEPFAFVVEKDTFEEYELRQMYNENNLSLSREDAIKVIVDTLSKGDTVISTTGMISRELYDYRESIKQGHQQDFLTVGSMGHASQIALGIALQKTDRRIIVLDGDGSTLMHLGSMAIIATQSPKNFYHIILNNGAHDSVGGQPTVGLDISFKDIAIACGYRRAFSTSNIQELKDVLKTFRNEKGPLLLEIKVKKGNRQNLGRPKTLPIDNKISFMNYLQDENFATI